MEKFRDTLFNFHTNNSTNMGFPMKDSSMVTYSQEKIGFNYFYCKRKVMEDGISTTPLDICLSPWPHEICVIEKVQDPLSNLFPCELIYNHEKYPSSEHLFLTEHCKHSFNESDNGNQIYKDIDLLERKMRFSILLKFSQSDEFCSELFRYKDFMIFYKQINYNKALSGLFAVTNKTNLIGVLEIGYL